MVATSHIFRAYDTGSLTLGSSTRSIILLPDVHQSQAFVDLHGQIKSCDEILETMENLLSIFQTDLGNISTEIQTLQTKSVTMSIQLKNRMAVESHLNELLEGILVTPQLIRKIYDGEIDETWLGALAELNSKMYHAKARQGRHIRALKEVGPELERLRIKVKRDFDTFCPQAELAVMS